MRDEKSRYDLQLSRLAVTSSCRQAHTRCLMKYPHLTISMALMGECGTHQVKDENTNTFEMYNKLSQYPGTTSGWTLSSVGTTGLINPCSSKYTLSIVVSLIVPLPSGIANR